MIKIDKKELEAFAVKINKKAARGCQEDIGKAIKKSCLSIQKSAIQNLKKNGSVQTGHLSRSIAFKTTINEGTVHTSNVKYASLVEKGARPHIVKAKNKKALYWKGASHPVNQVRHPGSKAKPFLKPAFEAEKPKFIQNLKEVIKLD